MNSFWAQLNRPPSSFLSLLFRMGVATLQTPYRSLLKCKAGLAIKIGVGHPQHVQITNCLIIKRDPLRSLSNGVCKRKKPHKQVKLPLADPEALFQKAAERKRRRDAWISGQKFHIKRKTKSKPRLSPQPQIYLIQTQNIAHAFNL